MRRRRGKSFWPSAAGARLSAPGVRAESALRQRMFVARGNGADDSTDAHAHRQAGRRPR